VKSIFLLLRSVTGTFTIGNDVILKLLDKVVIDDQKNNNPVLSVEYHN
jgi:hypothetical protein